MEELKEFINEVKVWKQVCCIYSPTEELLLSEHILKEIGCVEMKNLGDFIVEANGELGVKTKFVPLYRLRNLEEWVRYAKVKYEQPVNMLYLLDAETVNYITENFKENILAEVGLTHNLQN